MTQRFANFLPSIGQMNPGAVRAGWPVAAETVKAAGLTCNWLLSRGTPLAIDGGHTWPSDGPGLQTRTLNYQYQVDDVHHSLGMTIVISSSGNTPVTIVGKSIIIGRLPAIIQIPYPNLTGNGLVSAAIEITWSGGATEYVAVHSLTIYECPQVLIEESGCVPVQPSLQVYDGWDDRVSIPGVVRATEDLRATYFRRGTLFNWAHADPDGFNTMSTDYLPLFTSGIYPAIQNRLMYSGETVRAAKVSIYARVSPGGHGVIEVTMTNGDSVVFDVTDSTNAWSTPQDINVATDDPLKWELNGGIRDSTRDELQVSVKTFDPDSGTIYLLAISIWDPPG